MNYSDCILCFQPKVQPFLHLNEKSFGQLRDWEYFACPKCELIFMNPQQVLSEDDEEQRYLQHQNDLHSSGYVEHLQRLWQPLRVNLAQDSNGLDYGSGPQPVMAKLIENDGYSVQIYDKIFAPNSNLLKANHFDFVICNEVAEHFSSPAEDLSRIDDVVKPGGYVAIGTKLYNKEINFANWPYRRDDTHICFYQEATLSWLEKKFNWKAVDRGEDWFIWRKVRTHLCDPMGGKSVSVPKKS